MLRVSIMSIFVVLLCCSGAWAEEFAPGEVVHLQKISAQLRERPGWKGAPVAVLHRWDPIEIMGVSGGWARVAIPGKGLRGFLPERDLKESNEREKTATRELAFYTCPPDKKCDPEFSIPKGAKVEVYEYRTAKWARVWAYHEEVEGWVKARYLK